MPTTKPTQPPAPKLPTPAALLSRVQSYFPEHEKGFPAEKLQKELGVWHLLDKATNSRTIAVLVRACDADLDTDGSRLPGDKTAQSDTSLHDAKVRAVDANSVPYIVLPIGWGHGVRLGDYGVIWTETHICPVIAADMGPRDRISECSIEAMRRLGQERVKGGRVVDISLGEPVRILLFPGSGSGVFVSVQDIETRVAALVAGL